MCKTFKAWRRFPNNVRNSCKKRLPEQSSSRGFTLIELLVVIAIIAILAAILFPVLGAANGRAQKMVCLNNLKQVGTGIRLYADENNDTLPTIVVTNGMPWSYQWRFFKELTKSYDSLSSTSSPQDKLFACPSDKFYYLDQLDTPLSTTPLYRTNWSDYCSYWFSRLNLVDDPDGNPYAGLAGVKVSALHNSSKDLMVVDQPACYAYSWHQKVSLPNPGPDMANDLRDCAVFVDGHADYIKFYWDGSDTIPAYYNPPDSYQYQWGESQPP
jgi:prepilin-type N-terminal cleavage/methylation domain-containing protein